MSSSELKLASKKKIQKGSKSFSLAGMLLPQEKREDAFLLYNWCRYCDDEIDESPIDQVPQRLIYLKQQTQRAFLNEPDMEPAFAALSSVFHKYSIPEHYPLELLEGMRMDVEKVEYKTLQDLELYCYRVAGVVGLMMSHIIGVSHEKALQHACDMGLAMQLTNIARDIGSDYENQRIYLPQTWLQEMQIPEDELMKETHRQKLVILVQRLLEQADRYYESGDQGIVFLQWRVAIAIQSARNIYSQIGKMLLKKGAKAWDQRQFTSKRMKIFLVVKSAIQVFIIKAFARKWSPISIQKIQRYS